MMRKKEFILPLSSGLLAVLAFAPLNVYPAAFIALFPLLISLQGKSPKAAFYRGMISGFIFFLGTVYWVSHSMHVYGYVPVVITLFAVVVLCVYLALYFGIFAFLFTYLQSGFRVPASITAPLLWVSLELFRTYVLTGFPWAALGYSQYTFLPLIQVADITGIYGVTFLVVAVNGMVFDMFVHIRDRTGGPLFTRRSLMGSMTFTLGIMMLVLIYGAIQLNAEEDGKRIKAGVIQGNIPQDRKWDREFQDEVIRRYQELTREAAAEHPDLIIWPESSLPFVFGREEDLTRDIIAFQKQLGSYLLFGSVIVRGDGQESRRLANSAVLLSPDGEVLSVYDKIHLVPFGEYVPLKTFFPFIEKIVVAAGNFEPGREYVVMDMPFASIGNLICYEIIFPGLVRKFVQQGANMLVTITNDAWFGRTSAPYQHFSMAVFRAVENRVPVVRSANTGISGFIDPKGRIRKKSDIFIEAALVEAVLPGNDKSFYTKAGDVFAWSCVAASLFMTIIRKYKGGTANRNSAG